MQIGIFKKLQRKPRTPRLRRRLDLPGVIGYEVFDGAKHDSSGGILKNEKLPLLIAVEPISFLRARGLLRSRCVRKAHDGEVDGAGGELRLRIVADALLREQRKIVHKAEGASFVELAIRPHDQARGCRTNDVMLQIANAITIAEREFGNER